MKIYMIKIGEIALKKKNRYVFERKLIKNIRDKIKKICSDYEIINRYGRIYIYAETENVSELEQRLSRIFGIHQIARVYETENNLDDIKKTVHKYIEDNFDLDKEYLFKVEVRRAYKQFPMKSPDIERDVGGYILMNFPNFKVEIKKPPYYINIEIRAEGSFIYSASIDGSGGLPVSSTGKTLLLLSGGIDSPVAGYLSMKRGLEISAVYFHNYENLPPKSIEKVKMLSEKLSLYSRHINLYIVDFGEIQELLYKETDNDYLTILIRRSMMRISNLIAEKIGAQALITGDNLGQVASQTLESISVVEEASGIPILRPLFSYDKEEIISIARRIDTLDISNLQYLDCCVLYTPDRPKTKPRIQYTLEKESVVFERLRELEDAASKSYKIVRSKEK